MSEHKNRAPFGVGIATILTVLLVLSLTIFAALSLSSARADYALSEIGAQTVAAYYKADAQAVRLYKAFAAGEDEELERTLPMTENQSLFLHLRRLPDGGVQTLAWRTIPTGPDALDDGNDTIKVWTGEAPS